MKTMLTGSVDEGARRRTGAHPAPRARAGSLIGLIGGLLTVACGGGPSPAPAAMAARPTTHQVEIQGFAFQPAEVAAAPGDTVVWSNRDFVPHTATDDAGRWDSGRLGPNESWRLVVSEAGAYHCTLHPNMRGTVR